MANDLGSSLQSILQVPGLQELLNTAITNQRQAAPVRTAIQQQAANMLPNSAFSRPNIAAIPAANYTASQIPTSSGTDWVKILSLLGAGIAGGGALAKLLNNGGGSNSSFPLPNIVNGLKRLFGHGPTFDSQGNFVGNSGVNGSGGPNDPGFLPSYDPFAANGLTGQAYPSLPFGGVSDPSGGTGIGPGMQDYYSGGGGSGGDSDTDNP